MTFDAIERMLGKTAVSAIAEAVLLSADAGAETADPERHHSALQELLTALLAVLVTTRASDPAERSARTADCVERLTVLVHTMAEIESDDRPSALVH